MLFDYSLAALVDPGAHDLYLTYALLQPERF